MFLFLFEFHPLQHSLVDDYSMSPNTPYPSYGSYMLLVVFLCASLYVCVCSVGF
jgi:hypothetical protein